MIRAIVGANWGDEGKGKITDMYAADSDLVVRFQGGANAGHTIINEKGRFALHLLPSGVCYEHIVNIIGNGVALNIPSFYNELNALKDMGINPKILVSDRAQIVMPYHVLFDQYEEERELRRFILTNMRKTEFRYAICLIPHGSERELKAFCP